jgi:hypothetical protein
LASSPIGTALAGNRDWIEAPQEVDMLDELHCSVAELTLVALLIVGLLVSLAVFVSA